MFNKILFVLILMPSLASARVFDFTQNKFSSYFKGNLGLNQSGQDAFKLSSGANSTFAEEPAYNWGGEAGFLIYSEKIGIRLGYELVSPQKQSGIKGKNSSGTTLLTLSSTVIGQFPVAHLELYFTGNRKTNRGIISVGGGVGSAKITNDYSSITGYPVSDYVAKGTSNTYLIEIGTGFEFSFVDNVTLFLDTGYRYVKNNTFKATNSFTNADGQAIAKGSVLKNSDGTDVGADLSGFWAGLGFRFYFSF